MKRMFIVLASIIAIISCGNADTENQRRDKELVFRLTGNPTTLNPVSASDAYAHKVYRFMFESLLTHDSNLQPLPNIATNWGWETKKINGKKRWILTFNMKGGVHWSDGVEFTSSDIKFTYQMITNPANKAMNKISSYLDVIDDVLTPDKLTLKIIYNTPRANAVFDWGGMTPIPMHIYKNEKNFLRSKYNRNPVVNGAYMMKYWRTGQIVKLIRNTNFWNEKNKPYFDAITFKIVPDDNSALLSFRNLVFDDFEMRSQDYPNEHKKPVFVSNFNTFKFLTFGYNHITWNCQTNSIFHDPRVRIAMTHALNRKNIIDTMYNSNAIVITGPFKYGTPYYNTKIKPYEYNMEKAKALLAEAGWKDTDNDGILDKDGKRFEFELIMGNSTSGQLLSQKFKESLTKLKIEVKIRALEWGAFSKRLHESNFEAALFAWSLGIDPNSFDIFHSSTFGTGLNYGGYSNAIVDDMLARARKELNPKVMTALLHKAHKAFHNDPPALFIINTFTMEVIKNNIKGITNSFLGPKDYYPGIQTWYRNVPTEKKAN